MLQDRTNDTTSNVEKVLDKIIPGRGCFREAVGCEEGIEFYQFVEDGQKLRTFISKSITDITCVFLTEMRITTEHKPDESPHKFRLGYLKEDSTCPFSIFDKKLVHFAFIPSTDLETVEMELNSMLQGLSPRQKEHCTTTGEETAELFLSASEFAEVKRHFENIANRYYGDTQLVLERMNAEKKQNEHEHDLDQLQKLDTFRRQVVEAIESSIAGADIKHEG
ncbi:hypothetical protein PRNP1_007605 [Phytophthora ramorum]